MKNESITFAVESRNLYFFSDLPNDVFITARAKIGRLQMLRQKINSFLLKLVHYKNRKIINWLNAKAVHRIYTPELMQRIDGGHPVVLFDGLVGFDLLYYLRNKNMANVFVYFWNKASDRSRSFLSFLPIDHFFSYSEEDAASLGIPYISTFYYPAPLPSCEKTFDAYFLGRDKGRLGLLLNTAEAFEKAGLTIKIDLFEDKKTDIAAKINGSRSFSILSHYLSYSEYLKHVAESDCLIELASGNDNMTLRPLESLFYQKKLITNNPLIKNTPFYNESNILFFDESNPLQPEVITAFLQAPFKPIDPEKIRQYTLESFLEHIRTLVDSTTVK